MVSDLAIAVREVVLLKVSIVFLPRSRTFPQWKVLVLTLALWLLLGGPSLAQAPESPDLEPRTTVASNVRAGPGLQHPVRRVLPAGTAVSVSAQTADGSWLQLQDGSWIFAALVQPVPLFPCPYLAGTVGAPAQPPPPAPGAISEMPDGDSLRQVHLAEINALRAYHGLGTLTLHRGQAAQRHALELAQGAYVSHWDRQGLSPYMRYSREGGPGYSQENISVNTYDGRGPGSCLSDSHDYTQELAEALEGLMTSPGHREALLGQDHRRLQLGLARGCDRVVLVQTLISDLVTWTQVPRIEGNLLILEGVATPPARVTDQLQVVLAWEPLPQPYTVAQLVRTGCYSQPRYVAMAVRRNRPGAQLRVTAAHCVTPREAAPRLRPVPGGRRRRAIRIPLLVRDRWDAYGPRFDLRLEVGDLLATYGDGIYTVSLWGQVGADRPCWGSMP